jgi:predicted Zn-dependent protease
MTDTSSIVDSIVAGLAHEGLDGYEVYMTRSSGLTIEVKDGDVDVFVKSENASVGLRASKEERPGFAFCTDLSPEVVPDVVQQVVHGASGADPDPFVTFPLPPARKPSELAQFDHDLQSIPIEDKVETARSLEAAASKRELLRSKSSTTN